MNSGKYVFSQFADFLPRRVFDMIVKRYDGDKWVMTSTCWNQLLVMMYGQLAACDSLREVACIIDSIKKRVTISDLALERLNLVIFLTPM